MYMATKKRRINVSLSPEQDEFVSILAKRDSVPIASKISELLDSALEEMEDEIWLEIAEERESSGGPYIKHDELWKKVFKDKGIKN